MDIFYTPNIIYWWSDCYPASSSKSLSKGAEKGQFPGWDISEQLMSADSCSTRSSTLIDRYLLVYGHHLKLIASKKFYAECFGSEPGFRRVFFLPTSPGPLSQEGTPFLWETLLQLLPGLERCFANGKWPLTHQESEACPFLLADPKTYLVNNPRWCCIIRFHWIRSEREENGLFEGQRNPSADWPYAVLMDQSDW